MPKAERLFVQRRTRKQPDQIGQRSREGEKKPYRQQRPERTGIRQDKGDQSHQAEEHNLYIGQIHQQAGPETGSLRHAALGPGGRAEGVPGHPEQIGRAYPGQQSYILIQYRAQEPGGRYGGHGDEEKPGQKAPPLPKGRCPPIAQGRGENAEVGGAGSDCAYIAVEQK